MIITQFHGQPLIRYRLGDIVQVVSLEDEETGVRLPQIIVQGKVGETINLANLASLDEKTIWQSISNTKVRYEDWVAFKEYDKNESFLRIFIELKQLKDAQVLADMIDEQLKNVDTDYRDINSYLKTNPVRVTLLSPGTFQRYSDEKIKEGADIAHLKPIHINPSEEILKRLLQLGQFMEEE
jgi:phenylacetate-coenzyme A ligase PaaK-like adenylate-forming protein